MKWLMSENEKFAKDDKNVHSTETNEPSPGQGTPETGQDEKWKVATQWKDRNSDKEWPDNQDSTGIVRNPSRQSCAQ